MLQGFPMCGEAFAVSDPRWTFPSHTPFVAFVSPLLHAGVSNMAAIGSDVTELKLHSCIGFTGESDT